MFAKNFSEFEFTCGSYLLLPDEKRKLALVLQLRSDLQCAMQVDVPYYASDIVRKDICSHSGTENGIINVELKKNGTAHMRCLRLRRKSAIHAETIWKINNEAKD